MDRQVCRGDQLRMTTIKNILEIVYDSQYSTAIQLSSILLNFDIRGQLAWATYAVSKVLGNRAQEAGATEG